MFFLFGLTTREHLQSTRSASCRYCGVFAPQQLIQRRTKLSVFFIPLLTVKKTRLQACTNCGGTSRLSGMEERSLAH
ncbi:zinc-ribbon domain-containing protein [Arthrobacter pityocampae]|uniref:Zinc-ribbon domain-containing protein n=1 Tax=Arthrobacter pityocampae TaxID=547334 RepID=A0A2S5IW12_9MICC|nr:zinc-ribbon domain-containing protein [Arthrobacter pityocampae]PPB48772.1 zinc-ribbon domain-containing protein [Arthrobacter pityocampae]